MQRCLLHRRRTLSHLLLILLLPPFPPSSQTFIHLPDCEISPLKTHSDECSAWLVDSIPTDLPDLPKIPGLLSTGDVFRWIAGNASQKLDLLAQYWQLLAQPNNSQSGDYGYSADELQRLGASTGETVYQSLDAAATRGVDMRIIQHSGVFPDYDQESAALAASRPNVRNVTLQLNQWWGSGIIHAKVWIADQKDLYIGSANNDWKSLTQVKELGIYMRNCPTVAKIVEGYFENLWTLSHLNASHYTKHVWDQQFQLSRQVPCWSQFLSPEERCNINDSLVIKEAEIRVLPNGRSPLPNAAKETDDLGYRQSFEPYVIPVNLLTPGESKDTLQMSDVYLSFSPPEISFENHLADEQGWAETIFSAPPNSIIRISTMDWLGQSQYLDATVYWSTLSAAISKVVFSKNVTVKVLVAYWTHTLAGTKEYLTALNYTNTLCTSSKYNSCAGKVEIKYYMVPGFDLSGPKLANGSKTGNVYPSYTRVNHAKYAVSDLRVHIGTSNLVWDYFYTTSGVSFGAYNKALVSQLQAVFDADWASHYAVQWDTVRTS